MNECNILVSIIVPVYGTEAYLHACIDSICKQTYANLQIILVDDQSPDKCPEICDAYARKDNRIVVVHQKNKGVSGARNTGLRYVSGEYIMFVDSDDELHPNAVKILLKDALQYGADIVSATKSTENNLNQYTGFCENNKVSIYRDDEALMLSLNGDENTNSSCAKLFKASFIYGCLFEEGKNINEDGFFIFQCYLKKPVLVQHNVVIYQYNVVENSNSRQLFCEKFFSMLYFCDKKKEFIATHYPQYIELAYNMEVRTNLQFLDVLCRTTEKKYKTICKNCVRKIRKLYKYHKPINQHHKKLAKIVALGLYPVYKFAVRLKYYR